MIDKVRLFVFANTYTARVLLKYMEYMAVDHDFEIILLSECDVSNSINFPISVYDTLQQCVDTCTQILMVRNDTIPKSKIDLVKSLAYLQNKRCIDVCEYNDAPNIYSFQKHFNQSIRKKPSVLIVSYGSHTQISCIETIIYKLFCDRNLKVFRNLSDELKNILNWISLCNLGNHFINDAFDSESECDVVIECLQYDPNANNESNKKLFQLIPDAIIVSTCRNYNNCDEIGNIFKYKYGCKIDIFAKSELLEMIDVDGKRKYIFDFSQLCIEKDTTFSLNDPLFADRLSQVILPKIILPDGVTII